jgi:glycerophosphoryl diester phosphodiesterase
MQHLIIDPPVFAHRGASRYAPENTLAAFIKAKELGIRWLEFDVMLTSDEQVVVIHDETINRTTDRHGYVTDLNYNELKQLDAGSWFNPSYSHARIPLLSEVIHFLRENRMCANIEIKPMPGKEKMTAKKVLDLIGHYWTPDMMLPLLSSFSLETLYAVRHYHAECYLGLLIDKWMSDWKVIAAELNCVSVHPNQNIMTRDKVVELKSMGHSVFCYTVNDVARARELFSWGVDAVYSDCPDSILNEIV